MSITRCCVIGIDATVGQRRAHDAELLGGHADRTLPRIDVHRFHRVGVDALGGRQDVGVRAVALIGRRLRLVHVLDDRELVRRQAARRKLMIVPKRSSRVLGLDHAHRGDGAGIDQRIHRHRLEICVARMELNGSPVGSTPILSAITLALPCSCITSAAVNGLDTDWMVNA